MTCETKFETWQAEQSKLAEDLDARNAARDAELASYDAMITAREAAAVAVNAHSAAKETTYEKQSKVNSQAQTTAEAYADWLACETN